MNILPEKRKVLVIGGAGYIGSVLSRRLLNDGYKIRILDNLLYDNGASIDDLKGNSNFEFHRGDFCDKAVLQESLSGITDVVLLAALVGDPICRKYADEARRINEDGSINLIDRLHGHSIGRFVFISTCSNYGLRKSDEPADEMSELNPKSLYAETKVNVERYIIENKNRIDFNASILRVATAFGLSPRMRFDLTVSEFTRELALDRELLVYDENTWRPYCHVSDISEAIVRVLEAPEEKVRGEIFNVGSNAENYTKKMIVDIIVKKLGRGKVKYKSGGHDPRNYRVSFDKIGQWLDFKVETGVEDAIGHLLRAIEQGHFVGVENRRRFYGNYSLRQ